MSLYNLRISGPDWIVTKFDDDLNVESSYKILSGGAVCECPAGHRPTCRHRQMLGQLMERVDTAWFLDFDTRQWVDPTGQAAGIGPVEGEDMPFDLGPQGSLGSEIATPQRTILEESQPQPEPITKLDDSHPFRRRM